MKVFLNKKTGTAHYERKGWEGSTMCSLDIDENWTEEFTREEKKRVCKRCRVASGVPARQVYRYGPMAWKRVKRRW